MRTKLIAALRAAADEVEKNPGNYWWGDTDKCNCGIVAQFITGMSARELKDSRHSNGLSGCWSGGITSKVELCLNAGLPIAEVIQKLFDAGLMVGDFEHLEHLSNPAVLATMDVLPTRCDSGSDFIAYARAWAELLEKE